MLTCYFGVPGCGKTTLLTKLATKELKRIKKGKSKYKNVATINFEVNGCSYIKFDDLKTHKFYDTLILVDEITMDADNRNFKSFGSDIRDFIILHRHLGLDIVYATQNYENVDKKIRDLTQELWFMSKTVVPFFDRFTSAKRIYREININEMNSELTLGYRFCNWLEAFFVSNYRLVYRPLYYSSFDSYDELSLKGRPVLDLEKKKISYPVEKKSFLIPFTDLKKFFINRLTNDSASGIKVTTRLMERRTKEEKQQDLIEKLFEERQS